jgi:hypothetical protein
MNIAAWFSIIFFHSRFGVSSLLLFMTLTEDY